MAHRVLAIFRRRLFNSLTILSLLLCLATVALWARSYWRQQVLECLDNFNDGFVISSTLGELSASYSQAPIATSGSSWRYDDYPLSEFDYWRKHGTFLGFGHTPYSLEMWVPLSVPNRDVYCPHWFIALIFAVLPALRLRSILRTRRRNRVGLCPHCGYDLRASPDRCPECGADKLVATDQHR